MYLSHSHTHGKQGPFQSRPTPKTGARSEPEARRALLRVEAPKKKPKPLTNRDELSLVWRWQRRKDHWARDALVRAFQPAIRNLARKYPGPGLEFDDRVSLGNMGFLRALDKFDIHRRLRLWTYAHGWVRAEITAGTAKCQSLVHRPRSRGQKNRNLPDVSLNAPVGGGTTELIDIFIDGHPDYEPRYFDREQLAKALKSLGLREQTIFTARWLSDNPVPFPKLAAKFQISAERCRQIGNDAFAAVAARMKTPNPVFARQITADAFSNRGHSLTHSVFAWPGLDYPVQLFGGPRSRGVRK